jgi:hypothetical protein
MQITPEDLIRIYAGQAYNIATAQYEAENGEGPSLVEQNASDFIAECNAQGIEGHADDSECA